MAQPATVPSREASLDPEQNLGRHLRSGPAIADAGSLLHEIAGFIAEVETSADAAATEADAARFDALALAALRFQAARVAPYRRLLDARGCTIDRIRHWSQAPPVPTAAFRTAKLVAAPARVVFRSSGTTRGAERRSIHRQPFPDLYRLVIEASFPAACLPEGLPRPDILSLVPPFAQVGDSSLSFMVDHVLQRFGGRRSAWAMGRHGLDAVRARAWLERAVSLGEPVLVLATALALDELLASLATAGARCPLPAGSVLFETGGFKGRRRETSRAALLERAADRLGVPPRRVVREYGMTELTSQAYSRVLHGGEPDVFFVPPWVRADAVDPRDLAVLPPGEVGMLRVFDLGNLGSAAFLLTEDLACVEPGGGFRLVGRAAGAELRGCSLTAEELAEPSIGRAR